MPLPLLAIGAGIAGLGAIGKYFSGVKQSKEAKKINPIWKQYESSPYAAQQLGLAKQMFGGRMAGAPQYERNILSSQGNVLDSVERNATDASQALAMAAATQGQTDQSLSDLQTKEAQNKYSLLDNLNQAYGTMIGEGNKVYDSIREKYMLDAQRKDALASSGAQNKYGAVSDIGSMFMQMGQLGMGGGQTNRQVMRGLNSGGVSSLPFQTQGMMRSGNFGTGSMPQPQFRMPQFNRTPFTPFAPPQRNFNFNG